ncbi:MAG: gliding motility-associated C-terminal domain-containing protein, partial [Saprospiraceae bacterium]
DYQLIDADSFFFQNFTCDANLVDTTFANATGVNGECDSVLVNITSLAPSYEINIDTTTCIASQVGLDTIFMSSVFGCDSNLIYDYQLIDADSFFFLYFSCDANLVDTTFANATGVNGECDSVLVNIISLAPSYEINIDTTTCIASQQGLDTVLMMSQFGCDSTIIFNYELLAADTFLMSETTCDSTLLGMTTMNLPGMNGECDSILIINTTFACDTIYTNSISCNPLDTGVFILINGGNTIIDTISLAPTDSTYLAENSCNPLDTGLVLTSSLQNIFGCDSLIFTYTSLLPSQNILIESTTCDVTQIGTFIDSLQNQFGCDSIITNSISLAPSSIDTILTLTCFIDDVGTDTLFSGTNSIGCDSLVLAVTAYEQVIEAFISFSDISCFGESDGVILVDSVLGGTAPYLYSLDNMPFQSSPIFTNLSADTYTILIEDADGCQTLAVIPLNSINEIIVDLGENIFINIGDSVSIFAQINIDPEELDTIIWTTIDSINCSGNCLDFTVTPFQTTTYSIMIMDGNGCSTQDEITVFVDETIPVYIPNAFSPNGDNQNDKITIFGNSEFIDEVQVFRIFDRWGELVYQEENFQPNDPGSGWDGNLNGKPLNPAVFVYFAEVRFINGSVKQFKGDITLVR